MIMIRERLDDRGPIRVLMQAVFQTTVNPFLSFSDHANN